MANQLRTGQTMGFVSNLNGTGLSSLALSAAATWLAYGFTPDKAVTINKVKVYSSAVTGSLGASDLSCDIFSDTSGHPNVSLGTTATVTATPTGAAWVEFTGLSVALSASTQYWLVLKNANATPGTNYPTYQFGNTGAIQSAMNGNGTWGWQKLQSTNSGTSWGTLVSPSSGWRVQYSDGTFDGFPIQNIALSADTVFSTRESGVKFTTPANAIWLVRGVAFICRRSSTPTGLLKFRIYTGPSTSLCTLLAETQTIALAGDVQQSIAWNFAYFAATQTINPGTVLRVTMADTGADSATNYYAGQEYTIDSDSNSLALMPLEGTLGKTFTTGGATSIGGNPAAAFTDTATSIFPFALILDSTGEFAAGNAAAPAPRVFQGANIPMY